MPSLAAYQRLRFTLTQELGIDPSQAVRDLETAILRQDPVLDVPAPAAALLPASPARPIPAQLPPTVAGWASGCRGSGHDHRGLATGTGQLIGG